MENKEKLIQLFEKPGVEYRGKPFWSWNGELDKDELIRQVKIMKEMGFGGYFMHSRAGLITEYLGDEWFDLINAVADAGTEMGLESWLYDEDRWPSGSAGGKVTVDPQYRMKQITMHCQDKAAFEAKGVLPGDEADELVSIYAINRDGKAIYRYEECADLEALKEAVKNDWCTHVLIFRIDLRKPSSTYNGTTYIDTMSRKAVEKFIELTHEEYKNRCQDRIGTTIKGIFTDEPHRGNTLDNYKVIDGVELCSTAYTDDLFEEFEKRYGYDLKPLLPELFFRKDGKSIHKVKINYVDLANNLFVERFAGTINDWCKENNMVFTGHVLHEDSLTCQTAPQGSLMRFYPHMTYPGVDILCEGNRAYWAVKQLASAARQAGQKWLLSELYGCTGWQFDFAAHKAVGDWQALLGINLRCHHLSWYTMEGESKRDYPASILHQSKYYKDYNYVETYFARFGVIMSQGRPMCDLLVLNPIESNWALMYPGWAQWISPAADNTEVHELERNYATLFHYIMGEQIDFDYGEEYLMASSYSVTKENGKALLNVGKCSYSTVLIGGALTVRPSTVKILKEFLDMGGKVVFAGKIPEYVDGELSDEVKELSKHENACVIDFEPKAIASAVHASSAYDIHVEGEKSENVLVQARYDEETKLMYVGMINSDRVNPTKKLKLVIEKADGALDIKEGAVFAEEWDLVSGNRYSKEITFVDGKPTIDFEMEAIGEKIFVLTAEKDASLEPKEALTTVKESQIAADAQFDYELDEQNVCVLDFAKWRFNGGEWQAEDEILKVDGKVRDSVGIERRSGDMLQPWYAKKYCNDAYGDVEVEYEFFADVIPEGELFLAGERPEFCQYYLNGTKLECNNMSDFWIDICFKKMAIPAGLIQKGRNTVTVKTLFKRTTNIEALYIVGNFGVHIDGEHKRTLVALPEKLGLNNLREYDLPFFTGSVTYKIPNAAFNKDAERVSLKLNGYCASLAKVAAADDLQNAKVLAWAPYEADITDWVKAGKDIGVTMVCSRRNMFGPLHLVPAIQGAYGPGHFTTGGDSWTYRYELIDSKIYGITVKEKR